MEPWKPMISCLSEGGFGETSTLLHCSGAISVKGKTCRPWVASAGSAADLIFWHLYHLLSLQFHFTLIWPQAFRLHGEGHIHAGASITTPANFIIICQGGGIPGMMSLQLPGLPSSHA